jgi:hypothetical protein
MEDAPPVANQIDLFMHFLGASRDGLVARRVDLDTISSSVSLDGTPNFQYMHELFSPSFMLLHNCSFVCFG